MTVHSDNVYEIFIKNRRIFILEFFIIFCEFQTDTIVKIELNPLGQKHSMFKDLYHSLVSYILGFKINPVHGNFNVQRMYKLFAFLLCIYPTVYSYWF